MSQAEQTSDQQLFALLIDIVDPSKIPVAVEDHLKWLSHHFETGNFVVSGPLEEADGSIGKSALALLKADDYAAAEKILSGDPLVTHGVCQITIRRFRPRMHSAAFNGVYQEPSSKAVGPR